MNRGPVSHNKGFVDIVIAIAVVCAVFVSGTAFYLFGPLSAQTNTSTSISGISTVPASMPETQFVPATLSQLSLPSPSPSPTTSPSSLNTTGWLSYANAEAGYSLKYPNDWTMQATGQGCGPAFTAPGGNLAWLNICGLNTDPADTPDAMAGNSIGSNLSSLVLRQNISVLSHAAVRQEVKPSAGQNNLEVYIGEVKGTTTTNGKKQTITGTLALYFYIQDMTKVNQMQETFDTILTTIQFTQ